MLIGLVGFIGSGKGTVGDILAKDYGFVQDSFAAPLKDAASAIFGWDRTMLEGATKDSREWREEVDEFWSQAFGKPFTPRLALQLLGTQACRDGIHQDIWTASVFKRARGKDVVVTDCRFINEVEGIHKEGGMVIHVCRGDLPVWWDLAKKANLHQDQDALNELKQLGIHESERAWIGQPIDITFFNDAGIEDIRNGVHIFMQHIRGPEGHLRANATT